MLKPRTLLSACLAAVFLAVLPAGSAHSQIYRIPLKDPLPACTNEKVLKKIVKRFNWAERKTWHRGFDMVGVNRPHLHHDHGFKASLIDRRYCHGYAHLTNGKTHRVYYVIEQDMGLAGFGWGVTFCVSGLDPWRIYDGNCRVLRRYH